MLGTVIRHQMEGAVYFTKKHLWLDGLSRQGFTALAGLAASLRPLPADAACCSGPFGAGPCGPGDCSGGNCAGKTHAITGFCPSGGSCWNDGCGTCCDCEWVYDDPPVYQMYYCYCQS